MKKLTSTVLIVIIVALMCFPVAADSDTAADVYEYPDDHIHEECVIYGGDIIPQPIYDEAFISELSQLGEFPMPLEDDPVYSSEEFLEYINQVVAACSEGDCSHGILTGACQGLHVATSDCTVEMCYRSVSCFGCGNTILIIVYESGGSHSYGSEIYIGTIVIGNDAYRQYRKDCTKSTCSHYSIRNEYMGSIME